MLPTVSAANKCLEGFWSLQSVPRRHHSLICHVLFEGACCLDWTCGSLAGGQAFGPLAKALASTTWWSCGYRRFYRAVPQWLLGAHLDQGCENCHWTQNFDAVCWQPGPSITNQLDCSVVLAAPKVHTCRGAMQSSHTTQSVQACNGYFSLQVHVHVSSDTESAIETCTATLIVVYFACLSIVKGDCAWAMSLT